MAKFFYAKNVSFLISNSASFAEFVEALKRAPLPYKPPDRHRYSEGLLTDAAKSFPIRALASPQLKHRQKNCQVPAGGCWKHIKKTVGIPPQRKYTQNVFFTALGHPPGNFLALANRIQLPKAHPNRGGGCP
jgi:hypothetical protein